MHGEAARPRAERGVKQVAAFWRAEDGDAAALQRFVTSEFIADPAVLTRTRDRLAEAFESADGHLLEISRTWRAGAELERGPELPIDGLLAATDPGAHLQEDLFASRIAFTVLLNWPLDSLDEMVAQGPGGSRPGGPKPGSPGGSRPVRRARRWPSAPRRPPPPRPTSRGTTSGSIT